MKRLVALGITMMVWLSLAPTSAMAQQSTFTPVVVSCGTQFPGDPTFYAQLGGTITPVPSVDYDISALSSLRGEFFHISLPAGFDITGASVLVPLPLGTVVTTVFQDLNNNDVQDPGEPTIAVGPPTARANPSGRKSASAEGATTSRGWGSRTKATA